MKVHYVKECPDDKIKIVAIDKDRGRMPNYGRVEDRRILI